MIVNDHTNDRQESLCVIPMYTLYSPDLYVLDVIDKYRDAFKDTYDISDYDGRSERNKFFNSLCRTDINLLNSISITSNVESIEDFILSAVNDKDFSLEYLIDNAISLDSNGVLSYLCRQKFNTDVKLVISNKFKDIEIPILNAILQERGIMKYSFIYYDTEDELLEILSKYTITLIPDARIVNDLIDKYDMSKKTVMLSRTIWNFDSDEEDPSNSDIKYNLTEKSLLKDVELGIVQIFEFEEADTILG